MRAVWLVLGALCAVVASWVLGAVVASAFERGWLGATVASSVILLAVWGIPLWADARLTQSAKQDEPDARSTVHQSLAIWSAVVLGALVLAIPTRTRLALETRADWISFRERESALGAGLTQRIRRITPYIPRSESIAGLSAMPPHVASTGPVASVSPPTALDQTLGSLPSAPPIVTRPVNLDDEATQRALAAAAAAEAAGPIPQTEKAKGPGAVFRKYADSVVVIKTRGKLSDESPLSMLYEQLGLSETEGFGSGFVVAEEGLVVTNHHVLQNADEVLVRLKDGREFSKVELLSDDQGSDLSLLKIPATALHSVELAPDEHVQVGDTTIAIGSPLGLEYSLTTGIVSALRTQGGTELIQMQTTIAPGSSGGPLFSDDGKLLGVNVATSGAGLNHAVRVQHVRRLLAAPRKAEPYAPYQVGISTNDLSAVGIQLQPADRMILDESFRLLGSALDKCLDGTQLPENAAIQFAFSGNQWASPPTLSGNVDAVASCESPLLRMITMQQRMALSQAHEDTLDSGFSVSATILGLRRVATPSRPLKVTLRIGGERPEDERRSADP